MLQNVSQGLDQRLQPFTQQAEATRGAEMDTLLSTAISDHATTLGGLRGGDQAIQKVMAAVRNQYMPEAAAVYGNTEIAAQRAIDKAIRAELAYQQMTDALALTNYQNWLTEMMISRQLTFAIEWPLLAQMSGALPKRRLRPRLQRYTRGIAELAGDRDTFHGKKITFPLQLNEVPGASGIAEGGTFPRTPRSTRTAGDAQPRRTGQPIGCRSTRPRLAKNGSTSAMSAIEALVESAYRGLARVENDFLHGNGDALLVQRRVGTGSGSLVVDVGTSNVPWDQLTPGRVVSHPDPVERRDPGNGSAARSRRSRSPPAPSRSRRRRSPPTAAPATSRSPRTRGSTSTRRTATRRRASGRPSRTRRRSRGSTSRRCSSGGPGRHPVRDAALSDEILDNATYLLRGAGAPSRPVRDRAPKVIDLYKQSKAVAGALQRRGRHDPDAVRHPGDHLHRHRRPVPLISDLNAPRGILRLVEQDAVPAVRRRGRPVVHPGRRHSGGSRPGDGEGSVAVRPVAVRREERRASLHHRQRHHQADRSLLSDLGRLGGAHASHPRFGSRLGRRGFRRDPNQPCPETDDSRLALQFRPPYYVVVCQVNDHYAPVIATWMDLAGKPLPLSSGLLDKVRRGGSAPATSPSRSRSTTPAISPSSSATGGRCSRRCGTTTAVDRTRPHPGDVGRCREAPVLAARERPQSGIRRP
jgi:hypothetical protein